MIKNPICPYCGRMSIRRKDSVVYKKSYGKYAYVCKAYPRCDAYVGCDYAGMPLGRLANAELRDAKIKAHDAFDKLWRFKLMSRTQAYAWLAKQLDLEPPQCHIGMFDMETCHRVAELSRDRIRDWNGNRKQVITDPGSAWD